MECKMLVIVFICNDNVYRLVYIFRVNAMD